jgi:hypothetical protein
MQLVHEESLKTNLSQSQLFLWQSLIAAKAVFRKNHYPETWLTECWKIQLWDLKRWNLVFLTISSALSCSKSLYKIVIYDLKVTLSLRSLVNRLQRVSLTTWSL